MIQEAKHITSNMEQRGWWHLETELLDYSASIPDIYQIMVTFDTKDSMGANFINSVWNPFASTLESFIIAHPSLPDEAKDMDIIMSILSNYTPQCLVQSGSFMSD